MSFTLLGILNSQAAGGGAGAFDLLETQVLTSSAASVTFSSIPQDYKHLQIRAVVRSTDDSSSNGSLLTRYNGVGTSIYRNHELTGNGSSVGSSSFLDSYFWSSVTAGSSGVTPGIFGVNVIDILDYANTSKNTTMRSLAGVTKNTGSNLVSLYSGLFVSTAAISSITMSDWGGTLAAGSRFSLYGIKG